MTHKNRMSVDRRSINRMLLGSAFAATVGGVARAQVEYPDRPVRFVVPQPAGGTGDAVSRLVAQRLGVRLGKPFVIENKPGAGGTLGASNVAKSPPDGHSLVLASPGFSTFAALYSKLNFDPVSDFAPVGMMGTLPVVVLVRADAPYKTLADFIAYAKAHPGKTNFSSAGQGSLSHLMGALFRTVAGVDVVHVPYAGTAPSLAAVIGNQVDINFDPLAGVELVRSGKVRALASTGEKRSVLMPDVPTMEELGFPLKGSVWLGIMATGGTSRAIVERLNKELDAVLREPEVRSQLEARGVQPEPMSTEEFSRFYAAETRVWTRVVRENSIRID